jgi:hypothetical protein
MELTIEKKARKKVRLSDKQMLKVTLKTLQKEFDIPEIPFIENSNIMHEVEHDGHRAYLANEKFRDYKVGDDVKIELYNSLRKKYYSMK